MQLYQSNILKNFSNILHAFSTRDGGVSNTPYQSLNLAFHVEDNKSDVIKNHELLAKELDYNFNHLVHMKQIHSNIVHTVTDQDNFKNPPTCDALITNKVNTPLMVMVADCTPVLFYDSKQSVIAVAHAGRVGAFTNIVDNVINSFIKEYKSEPSNIIVSIGASIGVCCYEVGEEIYLQAKKLKLEYALKKREQSYFLDITMILKRQLLEAGILKEKIDILQECTSCQSEKYFSYRSQGVTGRFCGVIMLKE